MANADALSANVERLARGLVMSPQARIAPTAIDARPSRAMGLNVIPSVGWLFGELKGEGYDSTLNTSSDWHGLTSIMRISTFASTSRSVMPSIRELIGAIR